MSKRTVKARIRALMAEWRMLRFGLSEEEAAEAWAESIARHEDDCPALRSTPAAPQPDHKHPPCDPDNCYIDTALRASLATAHPSAPAAPQPDTALTVERLARARATDGGWKEPNVTDRKWAEQFLAILRALGEGVES